MGAFVNNFIPFECHKSSHAPKSMFSEVKERLERPKYNIDFEGKGLG